MNPNFKSMLLLYLVMVLLIACAPNADPCPSQAIR
jgi:hypothetical protein